MGSYFISQLGTIWNMKSGKELAQNNNHKGYPTVNLYINKKNKTCSVHRLVAIRYIPNVDHKPQVNHIDGDKENNHVSNLEWVTCKENINHAIRLGLRDGLYKGEINGFAKLDTGEVLRMRESYANGVKITILARIYNVTYQNIWMIVNRKTWTHL